MSDPSDNPDVNWRRVMAEFKLPAPLALAGLVFGSALVACDGGVAPVSSELLRGVEAGGAGVKVANTYEDPTPPPAPAQTPAPVGRKATALGRGTS